MIVGYLSKSTTVFVQYFYLILFLVMAFVKLNSEPAILMKLSEPTSSSYIIKALLYNVRGIFRRKPMLAGWFILTDTYSTLIHNFREGVFQSLFNVSNISDSDGQVRLE